MKEINIDLTQNCCVKDGFENPRRIGVKLYVTVVEGKLPKEQSKRQRYDRYQILTDRDNGKAKQIKI